MKKLLCVALLVPSVAFAAAGKQAPSEGYYGRFDLGMDIRKDNQISNAKIKDNKTPMFGLGVGYQLNEYFSSDLNLQRRNFKTEAKGSAGKLKNPATTLMLNGNAQLPTGTIFTPYATAGIGYSHIKNDSKTLEANSNKSKSSKGFAWNAGFGVKTKVQDNVSLDFGYKFVNVGKLKLNSADAKTTSKMQAHELTAGVIVSF